MTGVGNEAQMRLMVDQVAEAAATNAILRYKLELKETGGEAQAIPSLLKWAAGIITAVLTALVTAACIWMAVTLSDLKSKMDTISDRLGDNGVVAQRFDALDRRVQTLEKYHQAGGTK